MTEAVTEQAGSDEVRKHCYSIDRCYAINELIGEDKTRAAFDEIKRAIDYEFGLTTEGE